MALYFYFPLLIPILIRFLTFSYTLLASKLPSRLAGQC